MTRRARAGVDVGGTFTDVVTVEDGRVATRKTPSTPDAPEVAVRRGLEAAADAGELTPADLAVLGHGTTVATNAVLEGAFAETALLTTAGFRDVLEIGRQTRPDIYDHDATRPDPVVPRHRRHEVPERRDERGAVREPLDEAAVRETVAGLDPTVESVAVSLLFAFEDAGHEERVAELVRAERPDVAVSTSSAVLPEVREYERTLATALNAALRPVVAEYVAGLEADLAALAPDAELRLMGSNGGAMTAQTARERPVTTLLSGPAAGVRGAAHVAGAAGYTDLLTMDMGGTSCDVSLVQDGDPAVSTEVEVGEYPVAVPMVDVHTVGSGGGSVAWLDAGGALRVGPRSAGARPGPVAYGRGGERPTTTDAQVLLGRVDPGAFLEAPADRETVAAAMAEHVGDPLDRSPRAAARDVLRVANAEMERALRVVGVERGHDPRDLTLVAFGGAGPLHATALAPALDVPRVLVPPTAGVLSALGLLVSDLVRDLSRSMVRPVADLDPTDLAGVVAELTETGRDALAAADVPPGRRELERAVALRYAGQTFDLEVPLEDPVDAAAVRGAVERFHDRHRERYGHADPEEPVELVTVRVRARGLVEPPELGPPPATGEAADAVTGERTVGFDGADHETPVYDRARLPRATTVTGPAVVEGGQSTAVVRPDQTATVDEAGNLVVAVDG